jgi:phosphotriesterase-related protein
MINTVLKTIPARELGLTLPHEHLFTDLRGPHVRGYGQADPSHVLSVMSPYLEEISKIGVTGLVECSTNGVGRNPEILIKLAKNTNIHIIAPTGVYREAYVPQSFHDLSAEELSERWTTDLLEGMDGSGIKAGFIKMAVTDEGITPLEIKNLKAAALTSKKTGAVIACHTIGGRLVEELIAILIRFDHNLERFIWTHAQSETDVSVHLKAAQKGIYISIDAIGSGWVPDSDMIELTLELINAGYEKKILLSHDAGWYDPSQPDGHPPDHGIRGYTALFKSFIPALLDRGIPTELIDHITIMNPAVAFSLHE